MPRGRSTTWCWSFAISARLLGGPVRRTPAPHLADPALVELVLAEREAPEDRSRVLRLLGLDPGLPVRVVDVAAVVLQPRAGAAAVVPDLRAALAERSRERGTGGTDLRVGGG